MTEFTLALLLFLFPLAYSPGPGNLFFAANGARFGFRATLPASFGYHLATWIVTAAIGFGLMGALAMAPEAFRALRLIGAGYVLWLAWGLFRAGAQAHAAEARPAGCRDGVVLLLLNPKAYLIITLMFSQFLGAEDQHQGAQVLVITTLFTLNNLIAFSAWTVLGDRLGAVFARHAGARTLNMVFGVILGGVGVWMIVV